VFRAKIAGASDEATARFGKPSLRESNAQTPRVEPPGTASPSLRHRELHHRAVTRCVGCGWRQCAMADHPQLHHRPHGRRGAVNTRSTPARARTTVRT
jgi:hypothetical protein